MRALLKNVEQGYLSLNRVEREEKVDVKACFVRMGG